MTVAFNQQNRYSATLLYLTLMISLSRMWGDRSVEEELKDAEREREVLRDAYESQRLRLREFERRLLQLEDRKGQPLDDLTARDTSLSKQATSPSLSAMRNRLRALPVVMVKRDPPPPTRSYAQVASKKPAERPAEAIPQKRA